MVHVRVTVLTDIRISCEVYEQAKESSSFLALPGLLYHFLFLKEVVDVVHARRSSLTLFLSLLPRAEGEQKSLPLLAGLCVCVCECVSFEEASTDAPLFLMRAGNKSQQTN